MNLECMRDYIIIIVDMPVENKGPILMPDSARQMTDWCKVYMVGPDVKKLKVGDLVLRPELLAMREGFDFKLPNGDKVMVVQEEDIKVRRRDDHKS